jgi:CDP-2,3-bis-(O-geranylgeranyl)-sn-glycerol synthase
MNLYNLIFLLPPYVANAVPVFIGGELPIDDILKKRIFGKNKTLLGLLSGFSFGVIAGYLISYVSFLDFKLSFFISILGVIGALTGDLVGSFIKRKLNKPEGSEFWLDSILFIIFSIILMNAFHQVFDAIMAIFSIVLTFFVHKIANVIAHKIKVKNVPW